MLLRCLSTAAKHVCHMHRYILKTEYRVKAIDFSLCKQKRAILETCTGGWCQTAVYIAGCISGRPGQPVFCVGWLRSFTGWKEECHGLRPCELLLRYLFYHLQGVLQWTTQTTGSMLCQKDNLMRRCAHISCHNVCMGSEKPVWNEGWFLIRVILLQKWSCTCSWLISSWDIRVSYYLFVFCTLFSSLSFK